MFFISLCCSSPGMEITEISLLQLKVLLLSRIRKKKKVKYYDKCLTLWNKSKYIILVYFGFVLFL